MTAAREKIIEAMARGICDFGHDCCLDDDNAMKCDTRNEAARALAALAEQGYAVVPREATEEMKFVGREACFSGDDPVPNEGACKTSFDAMVAEADIARPNPAGEVKP